VNIVTGPRDSLAQTLAEHHGVEAIWYCGGNAKKIEQASADDLKRTWIPGPLDWFGPGAEGQAFLRRATQVKNVWIPYGA
jgi:aldehyde dehydrogenase (NAD+)